MKKLFCGRFCAGKFLPAVLCLFVIAHNGAFSFPGITTYLPELSGYYVYYRDYSFERESYVGFLQYDEGTYAARYYAPPFRGLPADEVGLLFTVDETKSITEMTGEEFTTEIITDEHIDIVNYLHDLVYEISSRRRKISDWKKTDTKTIRSAEQIFFFGGNVVMDYEFYVPVFNLFSIKKLDGSPLFILVTQGQLAFQEDVAFNAFTGITARPENKSVKTITKIALPLSFTVGDCVFTLDAQWSQPVPEESSFFVLGDEAIFYAGLMYVPEAQENELSYNALDFFTRDHIMSSDDYYVDIAAAAIERNGALVKITSPSISSTSRQKTINVYFLAQKDNFVYIITLAVYESAYNANKDYFDTLLNNAQKALENM